MKVPANSPDDARIAFAPAGKLQFHPMRFGPLFVVICALLFAFSSSTPMFAQTQAAQTQASTEASTQPAQPQPALPAGMHIVTVTFNYDFSRTPSCTPKPAKRCVQQFNVYDVSSGGKRRTKLFSIPAAPDETKLVNGITGKSPQMALDPGKHQLAVTAQMATGSESAVDASTTWVEIPAPQSKPATPVN